MLNKLKSCYILKRVIFEGNSSNCQICCNDVIPEITSDIDAKYFVCVIRVVRIRTRAKIKCFPVTITMRPVMIVST